jgi:hypothetical protein
VRKWAGISGSKGQVSSSAGNGYDSGGSGSGGSGGSGGSINRGSRSLRAGGWEERLDWWIGECTLYSHCKHCTHTLYWWIVYIGFPMITVVPPIILSFFTTNLGLLVSITGSYPGVCIQWLFPAWIVHRYAYTEMVRIILRVCV